jgi:hypothetical protein
MTGSAPSPESGLQLRIRSSFNAPDAAPVAPGPMGAQSGRDAAAPSDPAPTGDAHRSSPSTRRSTRHRGTGSRARPRRTALVRPPSRPIRLQRFRSSNHRAAGRAPQRMPIAPRPTAQRSGVWYDAWLVSATNAANGILEALTAESKGSMTWTHGFTELCIAARVRTSGKAAGRLPTRTRTLHPAALPGRCKAALHLRQRPQHQESRDRIFALEQLSTTPQRGGRCFPAIEP